MLLSEYIKLHYGGNNAAFARAIERSRQQVNEWIEKEFIVVNHTLYSPRRELPPPKQEATIKNISPDVAGGDNG